MKNEYEADYAAIVRRDYQKKWRAKNKDKVHMYNETYWRKRAEKMKAARKDAAE